MKSYGIDKDAKCVYCGGVGNTRDHILPQCRGSIDGSALGVKNIVPACSNCNRLRAVLFHCPAMVEIVKGFAQEQKITHKRVMVSWGIVIGNSEKKKRRRARREQKLIAREEAQRRSFSEALCNHPAT